MAICSLRTTIPYHNIIPAVASLSICKRRIFTINSTKGEGIHGAEKMIIGYSMEQIFSVVADVENYCKFVPYITKSTVSERMNNSFKAELFIGFPPFNLSYISEVTLLKPHMVTAQCIDGSVFKSLKNVWKLSPGIPKNSQSCIIDVNVSLEMKSLIHTRLIDLVYERMSKEMNMAFITEAEKRFGKPSVPMKMIMQNKTKL